MGFCSSEKCSSGKQNNKCAKPPAVRCFVCVFLRCSDRVGGRGLVISVTSCAILFRLHVSLQKNILLLLLSGNNRILFRVLSHLVWRHCVSPLARFVWIYVNKTIALCDAKENYRRSSGRGGLGSVLLKSWNRLFTLKTQLDQIALMSSAWQQEPKD